MSDRSQALEQALQESGYLLRPVEGNSMMPLLDQRTDLVKLVPTSGLLKPYDLPLYRQPNGALVLHRIVKVKKRHYVICGDNRERYERVPHAWVVALAVGRYRGEEYLSFDDESLRAEIVARCRKRDSLGGRARVVWRMAFPPFDRIKRDYPALDRAPILLPFCYLIRGGRAIWKRLR